MFNKIGFLILVSVLLVSCTSSDIAKEDVVDESGMSEEIIVTGIRGSAPAGVEEWGVPATAEDIGRTEDQNMADSLSRVTGVSLSTPDGEGAGIRIRGASSDNVITLNGAELTSADIGKTVNVSGFSSEKTFEKAEKISWKPSTQSINNSVIKIGADESLEPIGIDTKIQIDGFRARIVIDAFYQNPHNRTLEGSFKFRLPNNAKPYYFAFGETVGFSEKNFKTNLARKTNNLSPKELWLSRKEYWKAPKEAIMVSREKAAYAYGDTVARQIDPALLEWSGAGVFSANVFPLLPNKVHRIVIGYDVDLTRVNAAMMLDFPVTEKDIPKHFDIAVKGASSGGVNIHRIIDNEVYSPIQLEGGANEVKESVFGNSLHGVRIVVDQPKPLTLIGEDDIGKFFARNWTVDLPIVATQGAKKVVFALDTSLSASPDKFYLWVKLIEKILVNNQSEIEAFALMTFNIGNSWFEKQFLENNKANRAKLNTFLNSLVLEGATDMQNMLAEASNPSWLTAPNELFDLFILSDGAVTWGEKRHQAIVNSVSNAFIGKIVSYRTEADANGRDLLNLLAESNSGASHPINSDKDLKLLSQVHKFSPWRIDSIRLDNAGDLLLEGRPSVVVPGQTLKLVGRLYENHGEKVTLSVSNGKTAKEITLPIESPLTSTLAVRAYGQVAVEQLNKISEIEREVASAFSNYFRVPSKTSSLLMLESEEDYERYNIKPEQDAYIVKSREVNKVFAKLAENYTNTLADPKFLLTTQIETLKNIDHLDFSLSSGFQVLMDDLPSSVFAIERTTVDLEPTKKNEVPEAYLQALTKESIYKNVELEAQRRKENNGSINALKAKSSLIERAPGDVTVLREVAYSAEAWGLNAMAFDLHFAAGLLRPYEPQTYHSLAKLAEKMGKLDLALVFYELASSSHWTGRFGDFSTINKMDYLRFIDRSLATKKTFYAKEYAQLRQKELSAAIENKSLGLLVAIDWNTDRTDIDLHVREPNGEEAYYQHRETKSGGKISDDVTEGYGPEFFSHRKPPRGRYKIYVKYFSSDQNKLGVDTKVKVRTIRNWNTSKEKDNTSVVVLKSQEEKSLVEEVRIR